MDVLLKKSDLPSQQLSVASSSSDRGETSCSILFYMTTRWDLICPELKYVFYILSQLLWIHLFSFPDVFRIYISYTFFNSLPQWPLRLRRKECDMGISFGVIILNSFKLCILACCRYVLIITYCKKKIASLMRIEGCINY